MLRGGDLRETPGLCRVRLVAAGAELSAIELGGLQRGIVYVLRQGSVAGFAIHVRMLPLHFLSEDVYVAGFAVLVAGKIHRPGGDFGYCSPAIVPVLSETFGNQKPADTQEQEDTDKENPGQSKEMSCVLEGIHAI
jgi:hypothetical protein